MSELFDIYQTNFKKISSKINNVFKSAILMKDNKTKGKLLKQIKNNINESKRMIKTMEIYLNTEKSLDVNLSMYVNTCIKCADQFNLELKKEEDKFRNEIQTKEMMEQRNHDVLFNESIVCNSFEKLEQAKRISYDMEYTGKDILIELSEQSNKMNQVNNKIGNLNNQLDSSNSILNELLDIYKKNKMIIFVFSLILICVFVCIIIFKLYFSISKYERREITA
jgi:hypothetical protein